MNNDNNYYHNKYNGNNDNNDNQSQRVAGVHTIPGFHGVRGVYLSDPNVLLLLSLSLLWVSFFISCIVIIIISIIIIISSSSSIVIKIKINMHYPQGPKTRPFENKHVNDCRISLCELSSVNKQSKVRLTKIVPGGPLSTKHS